MTTSKNHYFILLAAAVVVITSSGLLGSSQEKDFSREIEECNRQTKELRFSCYRARIEEHFGDNLEKLHGQVSDRKIKFEGENNSYAIFGTSCHTFYHAVGDYIAYQARTRDLASKINLCPTACTSGCMMGLYKRSALINGFSTDLLEDFYRYCREEEKHSCAHEIGHILHDKYVVSILKTLDEISRKEFDFDPGSFNYDIYQEVDLNAPFGDCKRLVPEEERPYCYTGVGHNLFLFSEFSPEGYNSQFRECERTDPENKEKCLSFLLYRIGINDAAPRFLSQSFEAGKKVCEETTAILGREDLKIHCYRGVGGGIGLFIDSEYELSQIDEGALPQVKEQLLNYSLLCKQAEGFEENCLKGLLGTKFRVLYRRLKLYHPKVEELLPLVGNDEVVG